MELKSGMLTHWTEAVRRKLHKSFDDAWALWFIAIALCGFFYGAAGFFYNFAQQEWQAGNETAFQLVSAGTIPLSNLAICLKVGASLFMVLLILSAFRSDLTDQSKG